MGVSEQGQTDWHLVHRFRYHNDASTDPFENKDEKSYHDASVDGKAKDEKQIIEDVNKVAEVIGRGCYEMRRRIFDFPQ
jgi:hypothetical protein